MLLGCIGGALLVGQGKLMPPPVARALGGDPAPAAAPVRVAAPVVLKPHPDPVPDSWAVGSARQPEASAPPDVRALAVTELVVLARARLRHGIAHPGRAQRRTVARPFRLSGRGAGGKPG
ncbi:hypothetical protein LP420_18005 [Massilia sp. B-10]|nr:hypothetical protein LP420_18005 [Massilia sp. B-10]